MVRGVYITGGAGPKACFGCHVVAVGVKMYAPYLDMGTMALQPSQKGHINVHSPRDRMIISSGF